MEGKESPEPAIVAQDLSFSYPGCEKESLKDVTFNIYPGMRVLLFGANGSGKSTLLKLCAGRHIFHPDEALSVFGKHPFRDTSLNLERAFLDTDWGTKTVAFGGFGIPLQADIRVGDMMQKLQEKYPERRDRLIKILEINVDWRMHRVSEGQRRRVQLFLGLLRPFKLLLLDEVTASLDIVSRQNLLFFLREESETRGAAILYATHILDGLDRWPTHALLFSFGSMRWFGELDRLWEDFSDLNTTNPYREMLRESGEASEEEIERVENNFGYGFGQGLLPLLCAWLGREMRLHKESLQHESEAKEPELGNRTCHPDASEQTWMGAGGGYASGRIASSMA
jgi:CCR4-NOT complex subunit CAF16